MDIPCQDAVVEDVVALLRRRSAVGLRFIFSANGPSERGAR